MEKSEKSENIIEILKTQANRVSTRLGPCFSESCYKKLLVHYLRLEGVECIVEKPIDIYIDDLLLTTKKEDIYLPQIKLIVELKLYTSTLLLPTSSAHQQTKYYLQEDTDLPPHAMIIVFKSVKDQAALHSNIFADTPPQFYYIHK
jgi:GxxExxY protein